jgi:hypothetical protein
MRLTFEDIASVAKAIAGGVAAGLSYLIGVVSAEANIGEAFSSMTAIQWFGLALSIMAVYGVVYAVPNKPPQ